MTGLDQLLSNSTLLQDNELAKALKELQSNPSQLQLFLQGQQNTVYKDIVKQKDASFDKVYGELNRTVKTQESAAGLDKRNRDLVAIQEELYQTHRGEEETISSDAQLAERKFEMNEWSVNNKKETLYIYSLLFIFLSGMIFLTVLWRMGVISSALCGGLMLPFILLFLFVLIYRTKYTNVHRNKRYWNRRSFEDNSGLIPLPSICPDGSASASSASSTPAPAPAPAPEPAPAPTTGGSCASVSECNTSSCYHDC